METTEVKESKVEKKVPSKIKSIDTEGSTKKSKSIGVDKETYQILKNIIEEVEKLSGSSRIKYRDVINFALNNIKPTDYEKIYQASLTVEDKVQMEYEKFLKKQDRHYSRDEWIAWKLKIQ